MQSLILTNAIVRMPLPLTSKILLKCYTINRCFERREYKSRAKMRTDKKARTSMRVGRKGGMLEAETLQTLLAQRYRINIHPTFPEHISDAYTCPLGIPNGLSAPMRSYIERSAQLTYTYARGEYSMFECLTSMRCYLNLEIASVEVARNLSLHILTDQL